MTDHADHPSLSRRQLLAAAGSTGVLAAAGAGVLGGAPHALAAPVPAAGAGTPEQVHLTWGDDPATSVVVSWASPGQAANPRLRVDGHAGVRAVTRTYTDGLNGGDGVGLPRPRWRPAPRDQLFLHGHGGQRRARGNALRGDVPDRAAGARGVPVH